MRHVASHQLRRWEAVLPLNGSYTGTSCFDHTVSWIAGSAEGIIKEETEVKVSGRIFMTLAFFATICNNSPATFFKD